MSKKDWDIGMDSNYFYLFIKGNKKPVKKILVDDAYEDYEDGYAWGEAEYKKYKRKH